MDEFNRIAWERNKGRGHYMAMVPHGETDTAPRWTVGGIVAGLVIAALCGLVIWGALDDLTEHFKPDQPVPVQEETRPDMLGQIRKLEQSIAEVKRLQDEIAQAGADIRRVLDKQKATAQGQQP